MHRSTVRHRVWRLQLFAPLAYKFEFAAVSWPHAGGVRLLHRIHSFPLIVRVERLYWTSGIADDVPAMVYFLAISLVPFALGVTALAALLLGDDGQALKLGEDIAEFMPASIRDDIVTLVVNTHRQSVQLLLMSLVAMMWTSSGAIGVLERALARFTGSRRFHPAAGKLRNFALGGMLALLVMVALLAGSAAAGLSELANVPSQLGTYTFRLLNLGFACCLTTIILRLVLRDPLSWRASAIGGAFTGVCAQAVPVMIAVYVDSSGKVEASQVFLSLAVLAFGCWLLAHGMLFGAAIAAAADRRLRGREVHVEGNVPVPGDQLQPGIFVRFDGALVEMFEVVERDGGRDLLVLWHELDGPPHVNALPWFSEMVNVDGRLLPRHVAVPEFDRKPGQL
jgi:uncharacterized BrkB/YihY/UPF0761 family membrane protein